MKDITAGSVGGIAMCLVGHPLDTVKVRLQTTTKYKGTIHCLTSTIREEGFMGLYKGIQSPLLGMTFFNATLFLSYGQAQNFMKKVKTTEVLTIPQIFLCGMMVGCAVSLVESPTDLFKSQLQVQYGKYNGFFDCAKKIISRGGIRGMYQGLSATFIRNIPANSAYFGFYEMTRRRFAGNGRVEDLSSWKLLVSGGIAGMMFWVTVYPTDVIKSTMQTDHTNREERKYSGWLDCANKIGQKEGIRGFYKGLTPCLLRSFPANAVCFFAFETVKNMMSK